MSVIDDAKDTLLEEAAKLLARLPIEAVKMLLELLKGALASDDPARFLQRQAMADASALAAEELIEQTLAATATKKPGA